MKRSMSFRTQPATLQISPTIEEIERIAERFGVTSYSPALVVDFVNFHNGGKFNAPSKYRVHVEQLARQTASDSEQNSDWLDLYKEMMAYHSNVRSFVEMFPLKQMPGTTTLEKIMGLMLLLQTQDNLCPCSGGDSDGDADHLAIEMFEEGDDPTKAITYVLEIAESLSDEEIGLLEEVKDEKSCDLGGCQLKTDTVSAPLKALKLAEALMDSNMLRILEICRDLDKYSNFSISPTAKVIVDPEGDDIRIRPIQGFHELGKLSGNQLAQKTYLPPALFKVKVLTGGLTIRERIRTVDQKQIMFIIMDISGSTSGAEIRQKMTGIVMNRLLAVVRGDAEVYLGLFDTSLRVLGKATNPEEARELIATFKKGNFSGGGTDIAAGIMGAHLFIEDLMAEDPTLIRPSVVVLTDDDTTANGISAASIPGTTVHGFAISSANRPLVRLAEATGGIGIEYF